MEKRTVLAVCIAFLFVAVSVSAIPLPHKFTGKVVVKDGSDPNGLSLVGLVDGLPTGIVEIIGSTFDIVVEDPLGKGGKITFMIGDATAKESFSFVPFGRTDAITLNFDTAKASNRDCGNNVCNVGECGSCPIDCGILDCKGNNVCDAAMGETCSNTPEDCGSCNQNSGGSRSSGSSRSSGGSPRVIDGKSNSATDTPSVGSADEVVSLEDLSRGIEEQAETQNDAPGTFLSFITGAVIGGGSTGGKWLIIILILIAIVAYLYVKGKRDREASRKAAAAAAVAASKKKKVSKKKAVKKKKSVKKK